MEEREEVELSAVEDREKFNGGSDVDSESELITRRVDKTWSVRIKSTIGRLRNRIQDPDSDQASLKKELTLFSGVAYVVGGIIGSGIFITPRTILCRTGSFGLSLVVWVIGGMMAMAGGLCYIELGLLIRKSGAEYSFIKEAYSFKKKHKLLEVVGSLLSFLFIWSSMCIIRASSVAVITLTCARYLIRPFYIGCADVPESAVKLLSLTIISKFLYHDVIVPIIGFVFCFL